MTRHIKIAYKITQVSVVCMQYNYKAYLMCNWPSFLMNAYTKQTISALQATSRKRMLMKNPLSPLTIQGKPPRCLSVRVCRLATKLRKILLPHA